MKKEIVSVMMAACLFASLATGCGTANESETSSKSGSEAASVTSASEEAAGAVSKSGETTTDGERADLVLGATTGFFGAESLDVAYNWDGWIMSIYGISENLYRLDENIEPQPWIAESVETPDENTWVFTIRDGVTFSNGKTVDAKAVKACFERTYEKNERADSTLKIKSMEADGMKFTIVTPEPNPTLLNDLCDPLLGIYDATEEPDEELGVSCTGPYVATSFTAMTDVKMRANENYWGGAPKADTVELKIIDDQDALDMALANGEIDLIAQETANGASKFTDTSKYTTDTVTTTRANFLSFNLKTEGLDDLAVRQAINYCIDREGYADVVYQGFATPCYGIYPDNLAFGGTDGLNLTVDSYDADKAKEILADENDWVKGMKVVKMQLGEPDASGRRRPEEIPGSEYEIELDTVIMSLGTSPNPLIASTTKGLETNKRKCIVAEEENGQTSKACVFAGGDAVTGAATVILAMGAGKAGAKGIHELLSNK